MDAKQTLGEPRLLISRSALLHNAALIRRAVAPGTRLCAILKADAYGHGATIVADALCNYSTDASEGPAVDAIAVANIDEAAALPDVKVPIIVFRPIENAFLGRQRSKTGGGRPKRLGAYALQHFGRRRCRSHRPGRRQAAGGAGDGRYRHDPRRH